MRRTLALLLFAGATTGLAAPAAADCCPPPCRLHWYEHPSVSVDPTGPYVVVTPGRAGWVC